MYKHPRRMQMNDWVPAEKAISDAMQTVEAMEADPLLTQAVILLGQAKDKVSDFVDRKINRTSGLVSDSYEKSLSGTDCYFLGKTPDEPCWGEVNRYYNGYTGNSLSECTCKGHITLLSQLPHDSYYTKEPNVKR